MSQTSVVDTSMTPVRSPESTSFSIDWPPIPVAWKTRQSYSPLSCAVTCCTQVVVTPNMVRPMAGRPLAAARPLRGRTRLGDPGLGHAGHGLRAVGEHLAGDGIEALHVGDRVHHHDVGGADIGLHVTRRDRGDQDLGDADGQRAHGLRGHHGAARSARRNDAGHAGLPLDPGFERLRHGRDRLAAVAGEDAGGAARMIERDLDGQGRRRPTACRWWRDRPAACARRCSFRMSRIRRSSSPLVSSVPATMT